MIVLVQANVLTVGLDGKNEVLQELPIRVISTQSAIKAAGSLKNEKVDSVISKWQLKDAKDGRFLRKLKSAKPDIPTIVFVDPNQPEQEIQARSIGASAVLTTDTSDKMFIKTVAEVLGLKDLVSIKNIAPVKRKTRRHKRIRN